MNFDFSDDQHEIKRTARDLLASRSAFSAVRAAAESGTPDPACSIASAASALPRNGTGAHA